MTAVSQAEAFGKHPVTGCFMRNCGPFQTFLGCPQSDLCGHRSCTDAVNHHPAEPNLLTI